MDIVTRCRLFRAALPLAFLWPTSVFAQAAPSDGAPAPHPVTMEVRYVADAIGVLAGGSDRGARALGNLDVTTDGDLDRLIGWRDAKAHVHLLSNHGGAINTLAGTIQGVDNIEVADGRTKLYEAWVEQRLWQDRVSLLVGLSDLNVDFFHNERTRSTPLDPKLMFCYISYYLGAFWTVWLPYETRSKTGRTSAKVCATKSRPNFSQRIHPTDSVGT